MTKKKTASPGAPINFDWIPATQLPKLHKINGNAIYHVSKLLLVHDSKRGVIPGHVVSYNQEFFDAGKLREKGETIFHDMAGTVIDNPLYYYEVDKLPITKKDPPPVAKETAKAETGK